MSPRTPSISILLPVRNGEATLQRALGSCLAQTFGDFELIVVDDGSDDATPEILDSHAKTDKRIVAFGYESPRGLTATLQGASRRARAPLLARMDADDYAFPERLARQKDLMDARPEIAACGCAVRIMCEAKDKSGGCEERRRPQAGFLRYERWINSLTEPEAIARDRFIESPIVHPSAMMRRAAFEEVGGYLDPPWAEDYDLWLRMLDAGMKLPKRPRR